MRRNLKQSIATMLALLIMLPQSFVSASTISDEPAETIQQVTSDVMPIFDWSFDGQSEERFVVNSVNAESDEDHAVLQGTAAIVNDEQRGEVLSLSGGANGTGWLELPDHLYRDIEDELSISFWANIDQSSNAYTRLLSSTIAEKGLSSSGVSGWQDSEFIVVAGGGTFNNRIYTGTDPNAIAEYKGDLAWNANPARSKWQHIVITMKNDGAYEVYMDGNSIGASSLVADKSSADATMLTVLQHFFSRSYLDALTFNDFGRSLYKSDGDIKGKFDDIQIYNANLSAEQVSNLYEETKASSETPEEKLPIFEWAFQEGQVEDRSVVNSVNTESVEDHAVLQGTAAIVNDEQRGNVLSLSGGANGTGWLELPDHLYRDIEDELSISFWANIDQSSNSYNRLLSSTIAEKGLTTSGVSWWQDSEFIVVAGGGAFNNRIYTGTDPNAIAEYKGDMDWNANLARGKWQHIVLTMKNDGTYEVYLDGDSIGESSLVAGSSSADATMLTVMQHFFTRSYLDALKYNDFGRSLYTSDGDINGKFDDIRIYNANLNAEQVNELYEETKHDGADVVNPAVISVDLADRSLGEVFHGAAGALYAVSEPNVPDINTLIPIKPSHISQKPPNGIQHPTGDALRVADYFFEAGGEAVNIVMQDYYQRWYYPSRTAEEYINEAIIPIATAVKSYKNKWAAENPGEDPDQKFIYIPFNEPEQNGTRYPQLLADSQTGENSRAVFNSDWLAVTNKIKEIDPGAVISGVNLTQYGAKVFEDFIPYCVENDCLPDIISWHMLWDKAYDAAPSNVATFRNVEASNEQRYRELYPDRVVPFPIKVDINEYAATSEIAVGGSLVHYIARYDELKMHSMLPYWNTANSYGSLLAGQNEPNGAWWLYKWYADMIGGDMAKVDVIHARNDQDMHGPGLYGLSSIQDDKQQVSLAFGGTQGDSTIAFNNVSGDANSPAFLEGAEQAHVTVWHAGYTGLTGFLVEPTQIIDRNYPVENGTITLDVNLDDYTSAYFAVITPAVNSNSNETWFERFEAENAEVQSNVSTTDHYPRKSTGRSASNGQYVEGIRQVDSVVKWTDITVPADGNYRLDMIGGSGAATSMRNQANTGNANQRINSEWFVKIDDQPSFKVVLRADYSMQLLGGNTRFINLEQGTHSISISKFNLDTGEEGQGESTLDAIELTYNGELGELPNYRVQAEFAEYDTVKGLSRESSLDGFEGAGYVTGYGHDSDANTRFVVSVLHDGMYDVMLRYASSNSGTIKVDHDRKSVATISVRNTNNQWKETTSRMFLRKGINLIDIQSNADISLDYIHATFVDKTPIFSIEAENAVINGTPAGSELPLIRNDAFAKYASGGKYVNGITSYDGAERNLEIKDIVVPKAGTYKLVVTYANGESAGTHAYNNDVVERYAQISVNGAEPQTVYFKNTVSWQQFNTQTIDVELKAGRNTIRFSNNNTYDGGSNPYGGSGTPSFTPYTAVPNQYTPAFDRFDLYPQLAVANDNSGGDNGGGNNGGIPPVDPIDPDSVNISDGVITVDAQQSGNTATATIEAKNVRMVDQITVASPFGMFQLPAAAIDLEALGQQLGSDDWKLFVSLTVLPDNEQLVISKSIQSSNGEAIGKAIEYKVWAEANGKTVEITNFNRLYARPTLQLVTSVDSRYTTVVRIEKDGTFSFVPAVFNGTEVTFFSPKTGIFIMTTTNKTFEDMKGHWAKDAVEKLASKWIVNGVGESEFAPNKTTSRAEFAAMIVRALGYASGSGTASFKDISTDAWYAGSIGTAVELGLVQGGTDGNFRPNDTITRQEMAIILNKAIALSGKQPVSETATAEFKDSDEIADWAKQDVSKAVQAGLLIGTPDGQFQPEQSATRAEAATVILRLLLKTEWIN
ncbi:S-layer homology domain-containing protein [Paenibacillus sp. NEAU-GSW1]|uniref:S-layer homology domain-containing protein n=1 Tax=Paenibacillus sp. NEAU-GSW1 TaxID=2682486 RepID=UPI0012E22759|nr:S-layer homology domain-containing protein [Paenibacillus sp. NEAU-GSW1]MUT68256.1 hypothetical protein [Paenibacillus sp. NEAU-GSW1]